MADIRPCGDAGLLIELDSLDAVVALREQLDRCPPEGVRELVPAARTLLVEGDPQRIDVAALQRAIATPRTTTSEESAAEVVVVPVRYDGADLDDVAAVTGMSAAEVISAHTGREWTVAFGGFSPGFGYLVGGDPRLEVPRRSESRTKVPAGAVGLAGQFSGIYPRASPGGWQLIGHTELAMWQADREPPALLRPGVRVRFEQVGA